MGLASSKIQRTIQLNEALVLGLDMAAQPSVVHQLTTVGTPIQLGPATTPAATQVWSDQRALVAGADAIDLTALARGNGTLSALDFTGLKLQLIHIQADPTNTADIVVAGAGVNGYDLFGAGGQINVAPGGEALILCNENLADVGAAAKAIDITSADLTADYSIMLAAG